MNIGIDFDGVLFDSESMLRCAAAIFNEKTNGTDEKNPQELRSNKRYDWTKDEEKQFLEENLLDIFQTAPIMYRAKEVLKCLRNAGHKLYAITNRGYNFEIEKEITNNLLKKEDIVFDDIVYAVTDKFEVCKKLNIDLMIDDLYDTIDILSKNGIKCLYFRDLVLKFCENENVKEVHNWGDIYVELKNMDII